MTRKLPIADFVALGFLHEVNRQLLHPHGLALEVTVADDGTMAITGVQDHRDDPTGVVFTEADPDKAAAVLRDRFAREPARTAALGFWVQPAHIDAAAWRDMASQDAGVESVHFDQPCVLTGPLVAGVVTCAPGVRVRYGAYPVRISDSRDLAWGEDDAGRWFTARSPQATRPVRSSWRFTPAVRKA